MRRVIAIGIGLLAAIALACAASRDPVATAPANENGSGLSPSDDSVTTTDATPSAPQVALPDAESHSICALEKPIVSDDPCTTDADCAPATPCHATRCVGKANAQPRKPGTMCTQEIRCGTVDVNACGCLNGKCALFARR